MMQANKQATIEATSLHILPGSSNFPARATSNSTGEILRTKSEYTFSKKRLSAAPGHKSNTTIFLVLSIFLQVSYGRIEDISSPHFLQANKFGRH